MTDIFDIVVVGSAPLARLLAGLLRERHRRSVALLVDPEAAYRLPRGIDLSIAPMTRPETFEIVLSGREETLRLVPRIAERADLASVDPLFVARSQRARTALAHFHHMAVGYGLIAEKRSDATGRGRDQLVVRDATLMRRDRLIPHLDAWLARVEVDTMALMPTSVVSSGSGAFEVIASDRRIGARLVVLADADAILATRSAAAPIHESRGVSIALGQAGLGGPAGVRLDVDTGAVVSVDAAGAALGFGYGDDAAGRGAIADLLGLVAPLPLAARRWTETIVGQDGAAIVGRVREDLPFIVSGLGVSGAFLAPAIARQIVGAGSQVEDAWFSARGPSAGRQTIADIGINE